MVQATSPFFARQAFWCIETTLRAAGFHTLPYRIFVPAFGDWGFVVASASRPSSTLSFENSQLPDRLTYLSSPILRASVAFPPDSARLDVNVNRLDNQALVGYYSAAWERFN